MKYVLNLLRYTGINSVDTFYVATYTNERDWKCAIHELEKALLLITGKRPTVYINKPDGYFTRAFIELSV